MKNKTVLEKLEELEKIIENMPEDEFRKYIEANPVSPEQAAQYAPLERTLLFSRLEDLCKIIPDNWQYQGGGKSSYRLLTDEGPMRVEVHGLDHSKEVAEFIALSRWAVPRLLKLLRGDDL